MTNPSYDDDLEDAVPEGFHWRDGWYFKRLPDGSVRVRKHMEMINGDHAGAVLEVVVPGSEWASVVCSVSHGGETGERYREAARFHGCEAAGTADRHDDPNATLVTATRGR